MPQNYNYVPYSAYNTYPNYNVNNFRTQGSMRQMPRRPMMGNRFGGGFVLPFALGFLTAPLLTGGYNRPVYYYPYQPYPPYTYYYYR